jgi:hypothetical protein
MFTTETVLKTFVQQCVIAVWFSEPQILVWFASAKQSSCGSSELNFFLWLLVNLQGNRQDRNVYV